MDISFRKDRVLNSCCIYRSVISHSDANSDLPLIDQPQFRVTWDAINRNAENAFSLLPSLRADPPNHSSQAAGSKYEVVCIVPYLMDHSYFMDATSSIMAQTRTPDRIIIGVDNADQDAGSQDLSEAIEALKSAGLSVSTEYYIGLNGPYHILNDIVGKLDETVFLWLHDSDDISHPSRLERQIAFMECHHLDMCGSFELRFRNAEYELFQYPINVSRALLIEPGHCMLWPSSLIKASIWQRLSGCSDAYRFGADTEFQLRACFVARMGNIPSFLYARRRRENSLTTSLHTGLRSWTRGYINSIYKAEYYQRQMIHSSGNVPLLTPRFSRASNRHSSDRSIEDLIDKKFTRL